MTDALTFSGTIHLSDEEERVRLSLEGDRLHVIKTLIEEIKALPKDAVEKDLRKMIKRLDASLTRACAPLPEDTVASLRAKVAAQSDEAFDAGKLETVILLPTEEFFYFMIMLTNVRDNHVDTKFRAVALDMVTEVKIAILSNMLGIGPDRTTDDTIGVHMN